MRAPPSASGSGASRPFSLRTWAAAREAAPSAAMAIRRQRTGTDRVGRDMGDSFTLRDALRPRALAPEPVFLVTDVSLAGSVSESGGRPAPRAMTLALLLALQASGAPAPSDSWPGWRGADKSGVAGGSPPVEWSEKEHVRWKVALPGRGLSSPIVWENRVFVTTAVGTGKRMELAGGAARGGGPPAEGGERRGPPRGEGRGDGPPRGDRPPRGDGSPPGGDRGPGRDGSRELAPVEEQDFLVLALDRASGAELWRKKVATAMPHQRTHRDGSYASPTPATDGKTLFVSFGSFGIYALGPTGDVLGQVDLGDMLIEGGFGEGISPVLWGDLLIVDWDHEGDSFVVALEKETGKESWRTPRPTGTGWTTPIVVRAGGREELVIGGPRTAAYDPATGKELWHQASRRSAARSRARSPSATSWSSPAEPARAARRAPWPPPRRRRRARRPSPSGRRRSTPRTCLRRSPTAARCTCSSRTPG